MDGIDRQILNLIQGSFPMVEEPYRAIAGRVGVSEEEAIDRIRKLKEDGIIRRIGAVFDPGKLGFVSALCAARVPDEKVAAFAAAVNACPGVTHNYRRNDEYNIWFTVTARSEEEIGRCIAVVREKTGVADIMSMRAVRTFKIDVNFIL